MLPSKANGHATEPVAFTDSTDGEVITRTVAGSTIVVLRSSGNREELQVAKVTSIGSTRKGQTTLNFKDGEGKSRTVHATAIVALK